MSAAGFRTEANEWELVLSDFIDKGFVFNRVDINIDGPPFASVIPVNGDNPQSFSLTGEVPIPMSRGPWFVMNLRVSYVLTVGLFSINSVGSVGVG